MSDFFIHVNILGVNSHAAEASVAFAYTRAGLAQPGAAGTSLTLYVSFTDDIHTINLKAIHTPLFEWQKFLMSKPRQIMSEVFLPFSLGIVTYK